jgi:hypothetical protein
VGKTDKLPENRTLDIQLLNEFLAGAIVGCIDPLLFPIHVVEERISKKPSEFSELYCRFATVDDVASAFRSIPYFFWQRRSSCWLWWLSLSHHI